MVVEEGRGPKVQESQGLKVQGSQGPRVQRSKGPKVQGFKGPRYFKVIFKYKFDSREGPSSFLYNGEVDMQISNILKSSLKNLIVF